VTSEVTEHLFPNKFRIPLDLPAFNIQRARDHGLPPYNHYREMCGLPRVRTWEEFTAEARDPQQVQRLQKLYGDPGRV
jgi:peroxidase